MTSRMMKPWRRMGAGLMYGIGLSGCSVLLGCGSDQTGPTPERADAAYWRLQLSERAITLALTPPYDTITVTATPQTVDGTPIVDTGTTTYRIDDSQAFGSDANSVTVSAMGVVHALKPATNLLLIARRTIGNRTEESAAVLNVNAVDPVPRVKALHLIPGPDTSTHVPMTGGGLRWFVPQVVDVNDNALDNVNVDYVARDSMILSVQVTFTRQYLNRVGLGTAVVYGRAMVYGVPVSDSITYTITPPLLGAVAVVPRTIPGSTNVTGAFVPGDVTITAGGMVIWGNTLPKSQSVDVVFDTPSAAGSPDSTFIANRCLVGPALFFAAIPVGVQLGCTVIVPSESGGNIPAFVAMDTLYGTNGVGVHARRFATPGTYPYHSARYGTSGVIHVVQP